MRTLSSSIADQIPDAAADFARRSGAWAGGLALMAFSLAMGLALVSWSARDPSFNHAVEGPIRNLLGAPGAVAADFAMQLLGLAAIAALTPVAMWGWRLVASRRLERPFLRAGLLVVGAVAAAGLASHLPATDRWPLPSGLGGYVGDLAARLARALFGEGIGALATGLILAGVAIICLTGSAGFGLRRSINGEPKPAYVARSRDTPAREKNEAEDADGEPGVALVLIGAAIHAALTLKASLMRLAGVRADVSQRAARAQSRREAPPELRPTPPQRPVPAPRVEPGFDAPAVRAQQAGRIEPVFEIAAPAPPPVRRPAPPLQAPVAAPQPQAVAPEPMRAAVRQEPGSDPRLAPTFEPAFEPAQPLSRVVRQAEPRHDARAFEPAPEALDYPEFEEWDEANSTASPAVAASSAHPAAARPVAAARPASPPAVAASAAPVARAPQPAAASPAAPSAPAANDARGVAPVRVARPGEGGAAPVGRVAFEPTEMAPARPVVEAPARPAPAAQQRRMPREAPAGAPHVYAHPPVAMLAEPRSGGEPISDEALEEYAGQLEEVLRDYGIKGEIRQVHPGPVVTLYELEPPPGLKSSRVIGLAEDIARSMSAISARVATVQGRNVIGIELPNARREMVYLRELLESGDFQRSQMKLTIALGKTIGGEPVFVDLAKMPHLLVAGTTGSGKSVAINTFILSLLYRLKPDQCRLIMVDPKMLELSVYDGIPHLLTPVVTDPKKAVVALKWAVREMEDRYKKMSKLGVRNIDGFNQRVAEAKARGEVITRQVQTGFDRETGELIYDTEEMDLSVLPYIVVIVDEMADLMMVAGKDIEGAIQRLAQMARAAGIHLIMATQRPSVDVITGTIKANFPTRISFQVTSKIDSRTILGEQGAEQLLGQGDMLYMAGGGRISRVHGPFVSDAEVERVVAHLKLQGAPEYLDAITQDEDDAPAGDDGLAAAGGDDESADLYDRAVAVVLRDRKVSTSYIQRRLAVGYNKAASLVERMEKEGVVSAPNHSGKREILAGGGGARGGFDDSDD